MATTYALPGKVALVTGGARGIGFETARLLHARGASVAVLDLDLDQTTDATRAIGERTLPIAADVTDAVAMEDAVAVAVERFGGLDVVVANAGVAPPARPMASIDPETWERTVEVDLLGVWRTVRPALAQVIERRGHVVVIASVYAFVNGMLASPYAISKAGVEQLGRALRAELGVHGAGASVAYFGFIDTEMVREAFEDPVARRAHDVYPGFMTRRLGAADAGAALVEGIETRAPRIIRPRWWRIYSVLRGIVNPLIDARMDTDARVADAIRDAEAAATAESTSEPAAAK